MSEGSGRPDGTLVASDTATVPETPSTRRAAGLADAPEISATSDDAERAFRDALRDEEIRRTRAITPVMLLLVLAVPPFLPLLGGHPIAKAVALAGFAVTAASLIYLRWLAADAERFLERRVGLAYVSSTVGCLAIAYYAGTFSAITALVPASLFFIGRGRSTTTSIVTYLINVVAFGAVAVLIIGGWIPDQGLLPSDRLNLAEKIVAQVTTQGIFFLTFLIAWVSRRQLDMAVAEHASAVRVIAKRDALLAEARSELERALQLGMAGRFSEQRVGSFVLGVVIGRGAMGEVYEAVHR
jgi:hypothetical protein